MAAQETVTSAITSLVGSTAGILAALVAVAAIGAGIEYVSSLLDVELPVRQLMFGRNWNALTTYRRFAWIVAGGFLAARLGRSRRPAPRAAQPVRDSAMSSTISASAARIARATCECSQRSRSCFQSPGLLAFD